MSKEIQLLLTVENYMKLRGWKNHEWTIADDEEKLGLIFHLPETHLYLGFTSEIDEVSKLGAVNARFFIKGVRFAMGFLDNGDCQPLIEKLVNSVLNNFDVEDAQDGDKTILERELTGKDESKESKPE